MGLTCLDSESGSLIDRDAVVLGGAEACPAAAVARVAARAGPVGLRKMRIGCWTTASWRSKVVDASGVWSAARSMRKRWTGVCSYRPHPTKNSGTIVGGIRCTTLGDLPGASDVIRFASPGPCSCKRTCEQKPVGTEPLVYRGRRGRAARWAPVLSGPRLLCKPPCTPGGRDWNACGAPSEGHRRACGMRFESQSGALGRMRDSTPGTVPPPAFAQGGRERRRRARRAERERVPSGHRPEDALRT